MASSKAIPLERVRSHLQRIIVAFSTWYDNMENCKTAKQKMHSRAYRIQHRHLAEMNSLPFFPQGRTVCSIPLMSSLADAGRLQPPRRRRLVLLLLYLGFPRSLLGWGSLPPNLCSSLLSLDVAETSPNPNGERRLVMVYGP